MGIGNKLKAVLLLDVGKFKRSTKGAKRDLDGVGDQAQKTSKKGAAEFAKMGLAVAAVGAIAADVIVKIQEMGDEVVKAADRAAKAQGLISRNLAQDLGGADVTRIGALFQETPQQFNIRRRALAQKYDLTPEQAGRLLEPIAARITDPIARAAAIPSAARLGRTRGVFGAEAGEISALLFEQFGAKTQEDFERQTTGIAEVAENAAFPAPAFAGVLTSVAEPLKRGGSALEDIVADVGAFSLFFPKRPEKVTTSLLQISDLRNRKTPFLKQLLSDQGIDPETKNINAIMRGVRGFIQGGGDIQDLQNKGQFPFDVIRAIEKTVGGAFQTKRAQSLELFRKGFKDPGIETRRFTTATSTEASKQRRSAIAAGTPEARFGEPGSVIEAQDILQRLQDVAAGEIGRESRLSALTDINRRQRDQIAALVPFVDEDPDFTEEESLQLQANNALFPRVLASLNSVAASGERGVSRQAKLKAAVLRNAHRAANRIHLRGNQKTEADKFNSTMRDSIQFLSQAASGMVGAGRSPGGVVSLLSEGRDVVSTPDEQSAATEALSNIGATGGVKANQVIINNNGAGSRDNGAAPKADTKKP
jgi:hypothetical protein